MCNMEVLVPPLHIVLGRCALSVIGVTLACPFCLPVLIDAAEQLLSANTLWLEDTEVHPHRISLDLLKTGYLRTRYPFQHHSNKQLAARCKREVE